MKLKYHVEIVDLLRYGSQKAISSVWGRFSLTKNIASSFFIKKYAKSFTCPPRSIAHFHYVQPVYSSVIHTLKSKFRKIVLTFWGSDLLKATNFELDHQLKKLVICADCISFETKEMQEKFLSHYPLLASKCRLSRFGLPVLQEIAETTISSKEKFMTRFGIPNDKYLVLVGYNKAKNQQHLEVVKSFEKVKHLLRNCCFIIPWSYGEDDEQYRASIESLFLSMKLDCLFLTPFLDTSETANLRCITDVLVQVQLTDSFSASMVETLYAGRTVITGDWLPYQLLYDNGVYMPQVASPADVGEKLVEVLSTQDEIQAKSEANKDAVYQLSSWETNIVSWKRLYE